MWWIRNLGMVSFWLACFPLAGNAQFRFPLPVNVQQTRFIAAAVQLPVDDETTIDPQTVIQECSKCLAIAGASSKVRFMAYQRRADANHALGRDDEAKKDLEAALKIMPGDREGRIGACDRGWQPTAMG